MVGFLGKGFWRNRYGTIYVGPITFNDEVCYGRFDKQGNLILDRESPFLPLANMLSSIPFDEGVKQLALQINAEHNNMVERLEEAQKQIDYLQSREAPVIIQLGEHVDMLNKELELKENMIQKLSLELRKERKKSE